MRPSVLLLALAACSSSPEATYPAEPLPRPDVVRPPADESTTEDDLVDTAPPLIWYADEDEDGYGDDSTAREHARDGYINVGGDCDDDDDRTYPGAEESCTDRFDRNCDGSIGYEDQDGDGAAACHDCDDLDPDRNNFNTEICNDIDDDCDEITDEGFSDLDLDGICDDMDTETCDGVDNDGDGSIDENWPDTDADGTADCLADEWCDGLDNDGDGAVDEYFGDSDGDGIADCVDAEVCDGLDNDGDIAIDEDTPDTDGDGIFDCFDPEECDGLDNDGDGLVDEHFPDTDGDGNADCVDIEGCDGLDNDGDGAIDEDFLDSGDTGVVCDEVCGYSLAVTEECTLDLTNSTVSCASTSDVSVYSSSGGLVVKVDMGNWDTAQMVLETGATSLYWLNIGNSRTNNAWGGDGSTAQNDSEAFFYNGTLLVYYSDKGGSGFAAGQSSAVDSTSDEAEITVCDGYFAMESSAASFELASDYIFQIDGDETDNQKSSGMNDQLFYVAIDRVVSSSSRSGTGAQSAKIILGAE